MKRIFDVKNGVKTDSPRVFSPDLRGIPAILFPGGEKFS
jgi:hypothetical protein